MNLQAKEIYLAKLKVRYSAYPRPCVIIRLLPANRVEVAAVSSSFDLYSFVTDFLIEISHPDFPATGLQKTSYIYGQQFYDIAATVLSKKCRGVLKGDLAKAFDKWLGK